MNSGRFITLEGGEGVGKSTNLSFIQEFIRARGIELIVTREPGGTALAEQIRALLLSTHEEKLTSAAELLLVFAARAQHIQQVILPALQQGQWVLSDRFTDATYAYQGGGRAMDITAIAWLEKFVQNQLQPDLTLLLDAPIEIGMQRAQQRGVLDRFETEQLDFFQRVRAQYLQRAAAEPQRIHVIDASQPLNQVQLMISKALNRLLDS